MDVLLYIIIGVVLGAAVGYLVAHSRMVAAGTKTGLLEQENGGLKAQMDELKQKLSAEEEHTAALAADNTRLTSQRDVLQSQLEGSAAQLEAVKADCQKRLDEQAQASEQRRQELVDEAAKRREELTAEAEKRYQEMVSSYSQQLETAKADYAKRLAEQQDEAGKHYQAMESSYNQQIETLKADHAKRLAEQQSEAEKQYQTMVTSYCQQLETAKADYESRLGNQQAEADKRHQEMETHYRQQMETFRQQQSEQDARQKEQMDRQSNLIREQINSASEQILKKRSEELNNTNKEQLAAILNPLQDNLKQMREAVEKSDRNQATTLERLDASIKENLRQAQEVGQRADKLAQALTSENKTQGNFGELRLRTLLENMGLEEGVQFEEQVTMKDNGTTLHDSEEGHRLVPDVILHFPDNRDVIIDSKMSLKAFEDYYNADNDTDRSEALNRHIASVRNHVKELAHKNYSSYIAGGHHKLDFVLMYVYSESALQLALTNDPGLWKEAYDQGVVISGSQNLYMMLRVLEMTWRQVRQAENQDAMMKAANELVNRVGLFYDRFLVVDDQLDKTKKAFDGLKSTTAPTGKSIVTAANTLIKFGAQENPKRKHRLPKAGEDALENADSASSVSPHSSEVPQESGGE